MLTLYGASPSPFVRKVRVALAEKGIKYDHDPVNPFSPGPEYKKISPLGKIPAIRDGDLTLADSSVILAYLERKHPEPALYPADAQAYGRALWFEEYADSALVQVIGPKIFFQKLLRPLFMQQPTEEAVVKTAVEEELPPLFDYLESEVGAGKGFGGEDLTVGDIAVASMIVNLKLSGFAIDPRRWPTLAAHVERVHARPSFAALIAEDRATFGG